MTAIWYEVLPVTLLAGHAVLIRHHREEHIAPWMIQNLPNVHPNDLVVNHLLAFFDDVFDPKQTIVHSTSWRYEHSDDRLLLTYLAVLPQGDWLKGWMATRRIFIAPVGTGEILCGNHLFPPERIEQPHVVAHALDHLASLYTYDPAIQAVLEPAWQEILGARVPKPAGYLLPALEMSR
ncbi:MAG TPA: hypothetical protein VL485_30810 [Ktedonobacteraceae bacterium]|jgi:hypothetical protein|nr:hypothetical protein [Ktedonobacteraceae bacterium]